jgi:hypothetical protein
MLALKLCQYLLHFGMTQHHGQSAPYTYLFEIQLRQIHTHHFAVEVHDGVECDALRGRRAVA